MFDTQIELSKLIQQKKSVRKKRVYVSKLDKYTDQIKELRAAGASYEDIRRWLRNNNIRVASSTVQRWFAQNG